MKLSNSSSPASSLKGNVGIRLLPLLILCAFLSITYRLWLAERNHSEQNLQTAFNYRFHEAVEDVKKRMDTYEEVMRGVDGLFAHADIVERNEFGDYIERLKLKENYPGIQAIRYSPLVPLAQKDKHIAAMRKQGLAGYTIHPEGQRELYAPVSYIEPYDERNKTVFGYDTLSDLDYPNTGDSAHGVRRAAMEQARDSGDAVISGKLRFIFEKEQDTQAGFLMFLPVYRHDAPHNTLDTRRANIIGWISGAFRMDDLMTGILGTHNSDIDIEVYDGKDLSEKTVMYDSSTHASAFGFNMARFRGSLQINIANHTWTIAVHSLPAFEAGIDAGRQTAVAYSGITISLLLSLLTLILVRSQIKAVEAAEALRDSREKLHAIVNTAMDASVTINSDDIITNWNAQAEKIFGWATKEAIGQKLCDLIIPLRHREAHLHGMQHFLATGEGPILNKRIEITALKRDGHEFPVELSVAPLRVEGKNEFNAFIRDITGPRLIEAQREQFRKFFMLSLDPLCIAGQDGFFKKVNPAFSNLLGFSEKELLEKPYLEFIHPDDREATQEEVRRQLQGGMTLDFSNRYLCKDGSIRWLAWTAYMDHDDGMLYASAHDFTEFKQSEEALVKSEALLKQTQQISKVGGWKYDVATRKISWTDEVFRIYEVEADYDPNNIAQDISFYALPEQAVIEQAFKQVVETGRPYDLELRFTGAKGTQKWVRTTAQAERVAGKVMSVFGNIMDVSDRKKAEEMIWKQANFDTLTDLPNRRMFRDRLEQEIRKAHRSGLSLAVMFADLDRFNEINDTLGHSMGDVLLMETAHRISDCVRTTDMVARLGGDEFAVILIEPDQAHSVDLVARSILQKISEPVQLGSDQVQVSGSIGITLYPDDATEIEGLLKNADQAMYAAKNAGRNRHSYFTPSMQESARGKLRLINELRNAVGGNQLMVYFQPIVNLVTGKISKTEALVRWKHPERGMVSPVEFIPLAEETGLIFEIGDWVFHESARWSKHWRESCSPDLQISVNKSPIQFYKSSDEHSSWLTHLKELGLPGDSVVVEITEGLLLNAESVVTNALLAYRDAGVHVAIDDFGTGYSSLSYLKKFDIDYLKIDQSFTRNLSPGSSDLALSEAIIVMAHKLSLKVIAEGVETEQQRNLLLAAGCDYAQGYLYSKPLPPDDFEILLKSNSAQAG